MNAVSANRPRGQSEPRAADATPPSRLRRLHSFKFSVGGEEVINRGQRVVALPTCLAARYVREITHDTVGDDQIRARCDQRRVGFQLAPNMPAAVVGVEQNERCVSGVPQGLDLIDDSGVGRITLDQGDPWRQSMALKRLAHTGPHLDIDAHNTSFAQGFAERRVINQRAALEDSRLDHQVGLHLVEDLLHADQVFR